MHYFFRATLPARRHQSPWCILAQISHSMGQHREVVCLTLEAPSFPGLDPSSCSRSPSLSSSSRGTLSCPSPSPSRWPFYWPPPLVVSRPDASHVSSLSQSPASSPLPSSAPADTSLPASSSTSPAACPPTGSASSTKSPPFTPPPNNPWKKPSPPSRTSAETLPPAPAP